jgi:hypothetical protein
VFELVFDFKGDEPAAAGAMLDKIEGKSVRRENSRWYWSFEDIFRMAGRFPKYHI